MEEHGTPFVSLSIRAFVDPNDPDDVSEVNALQDAVELNAGSEGPYTHPEYDPATLDDTREPLLRLAEGVSDADGMFGKREDVDPVRHLIGTAFGWGGLPVTEAFYCTEATPRPVGHYTLPLESVPVDAFWSIAIYNKDGYFEANPYNSFGLNSITAKPDERGRVTLNLAPEPGDLANHAYIMDGCNYVSGYTNPKRPSSTRPGHHQHHDQLTETTADAGDPIRPYGPPICAAMSGVLDPVATKGPQVQMPSPPPTCPNPTECCELVDEEVGAKPVPCPERLLARQVNPRFDCSRVREEVVCATMARWRSLCLSLPSGSVSPLVR